MTPDSTTKYIDNMSELPEPLIPTSREVMTYAGYHVNGETKSFDWASFKESLDYRKGTELTFDKFDQQNVHQDDASVEAISNKIADYLYDSLQVRVTTNREELAKKLSAMLSNPEQKSREGCLTYSKGRDGKSTEWEYRFAFANTKSDASDYFTTALVTINLTEKVITKDSGWIHRSKSVSSDFSASIKTMQLVVKKGFESSPPSDS